MNRSDLVNLLDRYHSRHPEETATLDRLRGLLANFDRCFHRDCFPGHITSSAWIVSRESGAVLLTHHRKLGRWLQLGGHADGEVDVLASALREAEEESGLRDFRSLPENGSPEILDLDVHDIPAHGADPTHQHHDIRFLLEVSDQQPILHQESESKEVRWFPKRDVANLFYEESLLRMARKASDWLSRAPVGPR
ncbi:MAG: NUDIX hydrolase [Myxococcales bacterium]|nr:NUDIX domain-containing protein [Myxococcales bacterium]HIK85654.1 NUDIX domain-containing protein [Myxococcales bacterium]